MHRDMIRKHPIQHIEIISHPMRFHIWENTEMVEKTSQENHMKISDTFIRILQ